MMQPKYRMMTAALLLLWGVAFTRAGTAQQPAPPAPTPPAQTPPAQAPQQPPAGRGRGTQPGTFPAQQRPAGDPALIERGRGVYSATCAACHGATGLDGLKSVELTVAMAKSAWGGGHVDLKR